MNQFSLTAAGTIGSTFWKRLRRHLFEAGTAGTVGVAAGAGLLFVAAALEPNLSGVWVRNDGSEARLFHNGVQVRAIFEKVSPELERHGFHIGDTHFIASLSSQQLDGHISIRTEKKTWNECGARVQHQHETPITIHVADNFDEMQGTWQQLSLDLDNCIEKRGISQNSIKYVRKR